MSYQVVDVRNILDQELKREITGFWVGEGALSQEEADKRIHQLLQIAREGETGKIVGICTGFVFLVESMKLHFFQYRSFIGAGHRNSGLARQLLTSSFVLLNQDFVAGRQTQAVGIFLDIENEILKQQKDAVWKAAGDFYFVGLGRNGNHFRLAYFDRAQIG